MHLAAKRIRRLADEREARAPPPTPRQLEREWDEKVLRQALVNVIGPDHPESRVQGWLDVLRTMYPYSLSSVVYEILEPEDRTRAWNKARAHVEEQVRAGLRRAAQAAADRAGTW